MIPHKLWFQLVSWKIGEYSVPNKKLLLIIFVSYCSMLNVLLRLETFHLETKL
jgi:hypothetical protein